MSLLHIFTLLIPTSHNIYTMAELAVAAGIVGVGSLTIQLLDQAQKLRKRLKSIKDLPAGIQDMLEELQLLALILRRHQATGTECVFSHQQWSFRRCESLLRLLQGLVEDVYYQCDCKGHTLSWFTFRASRRKEEIDKILGRTQRAVSLLRMVNQIEGLQALSTIQTQESILIIYVHSHSQSQKLDRILGQITRLSKISQDNDGASSDFSFQYPVLQSLVLPSMPHSPDAIVSQSRSTVYQTMSGFIRFSNISRFIKNYRQEYCNSKPFNSTMAGWCVDWQPST